MADFLFDAVIGDRVHFGTTAAKLRAQGVADADVVAASSAAIARAVEAEMRRRIDGAWAGKRASAQSYWLALAVKGAGATVAEIADRDAIASGEAWESAMLDRAKALAASGGLDTARADGAWPPVPAALAALIAQPFAL